MEYQEYSDGRYDLEEREAKTARHGMWIGKFIPPWDWRRGDRLRSEHVSDGQPVGCDIEGTISSNGRIYHMPGQQDYARTRISEADGER